MDFARKSLNAAGFVGWVPFADIQLIASCPPVGGVYVVVYEGGDPSVYPEKSCGGWFKGKNPSLSQQDLSANWVENAEVVYIGKANNLRRRIREFDAFGRGKPVGHWGGRLIWQLPDVSKLRVSWKETPGRMPLQVETELIQEFRQAYGRSPFANNPHKLGD